jgi:hypothetical protein
MYSHFTHQATAYILRWNMGERRIIGVFLLPEHVETYLDENFLPSEVEDEIVIIEQGKVYVKS